MLLCLGSFYIYISTRYLHITSYTYSFCEVGHQKFHPSPPAPGPPFEYLTIHSETTDTLMCSKQAATAFKLDHPQPSQRLGVLTAYSWKREHLQGTDLNSPSFFIPHPQFFFTSRPQLQSDTDKWHNLRLFRPIRPNAQTDASTATNKLHKWTSSKRSSSPAAWKQSLLPRHPQFPL